MQPVSLAARLEMRKRPNKSPIMHQNWKDLLFLHWRCDTDEIQKTLPPGLFVDTFEGHAYVAIIAFSLENARLAYMPPLPGYANFIEVNVRTYVHDKAGTPGVWFYSLDINSSFAPKVARAFFSLPYFDAELSMAKSASTITVEGERKAPPVPIKFVYEPIGNPYEAEPSSLDFFLVERYVLFSFASNQLSVGRVHHSPYRLSGASVPYLNHHLLEINSLHPFSQQPDHIHYSPGVEAEIFNLTDPY